MTPDDPCATAAAPTPIERLSAALLSTCDEFLRLDRRLRHLGVYAAHYRGPAAVKPSLRGRRQRW